MPFDGLARQISNEHLHRQRAASNASRFSNASSLEQGNSVRRQPTVASIPEAEGDQQARFESPTARLGLPSPIIVEPITNEKATGQPAPRSRSSSQTLAEGESAAPAGKASDSEKPALEKKGTQSGPSLTTRLSKRLTKQKTEKEHHDEFEVTIEGREHLDPHTWKDSYRWFLTAFVGLLVLNATFASSAPSNLIPSIISHYGVSSEVGTLTISVFVAGYMIGPLVWGPLSERFGRRLVFLASFLPYVGFQVGCALSPNIGALIVFRFLSGCFAASPLTNSGGVIADLWDADRRGIALALFALMPFLGPALAPMISGAMEVTGTNFRWIFWVLTIFAGVCFVGIIVLLPETYKPYILHQEAKRLRKETGDDRYWTVSEHPGHKATFKEVLDKTLLKPFVMIVQEPMLLLITLYMSFIYGIVYLLFEALPIVFGEEHGLNALKVGLTFLSLPVGGVTAVMIYIIYFNRRYMRKHHALKGKMVPPEERLQPMMYAAPLFATAFFWFGWTSYPSISIWSPIISVALLGGCILMIFLGGFNYLIDAYLMNAASALAINTVVRSAFGAGFPLFATQMFNTLGTPGASSLLGGLAIVFVPAPFLLYKFGKKIRQMSKNAHVMD